MIGFTHVHKIVLLLGVYVWFYVLTSKNNKINGVRVDTYHISHIKLICIRFTIAFCQLSNYGENFNYITERVRSLMMSCMVNMYGLTQAHHNTMYQDIAFLTISTPYSKS